MICVNLVNQVYPSLVVLTEQLVHFRLFGKLEGVAYENAENRYQLRTMAVWRSW